MWTEVVKVIMKPDPSSLRSMEQTLSRRFTSVAKKFGRGLAGAMKGGGIAAAAMSIVDRLLNPLEEVKAAIERTLKASDDLVTNAKQFGTTSGNLAKLVAFGKASGLSPEDLYMLMAKFQTSIAEANADPTKNTSVRNFAGESDIATAFFEFIQQLQKMEKNQQILVQQEIFGEKQLLKMSDFLNSDFNAMSKRFGGSTNSATANINRLGDYNDEMDTREAVRWYKDFITKGGVINKGSINALDSAAAMNLAKENERIARIESIVSIEQQMTKLSGTVEKAANMFFKELPIVMTTLQRVGEAMQESIKGWGMIFKLVKESRLFKGIFNTKGE